MGDELTARDSRSVGLARYRFAIRGTDGVVFDHVIETYHSAHAFSQVRSLFGNRVIALKLVERID